MKRTMKKGAKNMLRIAGGLVFIIALYFGYTKFIKSDRADITAAINTWGWAPGPYYNKGFSTSDTSRFVTEQGISVDFKLNDNFEISRQMFMAGEVDILWATVDSYPLDLNGIATSKPKIFFQADWSRGGDAIVVKRGINSVKDLKGKSIACTEMSPSHSFLIDLLEAGGIGFDEIVLVKTENGIDAAKMFQAGKVDAAVVWSPDDADCVSAVEGSKVLQSTKTATHIISDVFYAKESFIEKNRDKLISFVRGWLIATSELNASSENRTLAAMYLADGFGMPVDFCEIAISNVRLTTLGDNEDFFNLNRNYKGVTGQDIFDKMKAKYNKYGYETSAAGDWRNVIDLSIIKALHDDKVLLAGNQSSETGFVFDEPIASNVKISDTDFVATKSAAINFCNDCSALSDEAKNIIDAQFSDIAKTYTARFLIEGNTDNIGNYDYNVKLSQKRAEAVKAYLVETYRINPNSFVIRGNGPDKAVKAGIKTPSQEYRRTDMSILK